MKHTPLTITIVVSYTYPFIGSGIGNVALQQAECLAKRKHRVTIVSSNVPETKKEFTRNTVRFLKMNAWNFLYRLHVPVPLFLFNSQVVALIKRSDIIHVHDLLYPSSFLAVLYAWFYKKPVVLTQHIPFISYPTAVLNAVQKLAFFTIGTFILSTSRKIIYFNSEVGTWLRKYQKALVFLPNGVNTSFFHPVSPKTIPSLRKKYGLPLSRPIVTFVGRLVPKKGYDLIYAASDASYCTLFVGSGEVPEEMKKNPNVIFLGQRSPEELREIYQLSDLFLLPSRDEGFPLSVQEAMATGLPIIVSDLQCYDDLHLDRTLVRRIRPSVAEIRKTISDLLSHPQRMRQMKQYSLRTAQQGHTWEKHTDMLLQIYRKVVTNE